MFATEILNNSLPGATRVSDKLTVLRFATEILNNSLRDAIHEYNILTVPGIGYHNLPYFCNKVMGYYVGGV